MTSHIQRKLRYLITNDKRDNIFDILLSISEDDEQNDILSMMSNYNILKKQQSNGLITHADLTIGLSKTTSALLGCVESKKSDIRILKIFLQNKINENSLFEAIELLYKFLPQNPILKEYYEQDEEKEVGSKLENELKRIIEYELNDFKKEWTEAFFAIHEPKDISLEEEKISDYCIIEPPKDLGNKHELLRHYQRNLILGFEFFEMRKYEDAYHYYNLRFANNFFRKKDLEFMS